jgi:hypothetical protein
LLSSLVLSIIITGSVGEARALDGLGPIGFNEAGAPRLNPYLLGGSFIGAFHTPESTRPRNLAAGVTAEISFWFAETSYGSLLGIEMIGDLHIAGEKGTDKRYLMASLDSKLSFTLIPTHNVEFGFPPALMILGGISRAGRNDVWWDRGGRNTWSVGARTMLLPLSLEYHYEKPLGALEAHPTLGVLERRDTHNIEARVFLPGLSGAAMFGLEYARGLTWVTGTSEALVDNTVTFVVGGFGLR